MAAGFCTRDQLGRFILNLPAGKSVNETSFWSALVELPTNRTAGDQKASGFWDNPEGNPTPPDSPYTSPWRRRSVDDIEILARWAPTSTGSNNFLTYSGPIHYPVSKTGYYCVGRSSQALDSFLVLNVNRCSCHSRHYPGINPEGSYRYSISSGIQGNCAIQKYF